MQLGGWLRLLILSERGDGLGVREAEAGRLMLLGTRRVATGDRCIGLRHVLVDLQVIIVIRPRVNW